jgi:outer membrane protein TolC
MNANTAIRSILTAAAMASLAAAGAAATPLSLREARSAALERSAAVAQAALAVRSANLSERTAKADFLPSVSAGASYAGASQDWSDPEATPSANLTANLALFSGGAVVAAVKTAGLRTVQAGEDLRAARLATIAELDARYLNALKTKRAYDAALKDLEASRRRLEIAEAKRAAGALAETDYLETQASWATKRTASTAAKWAAEAASRSLDSYLGARIEPEEIDEAEFAPLAAAIRSKAEADLDAFVDALYQRGRAADPTLRRQAAGEAIAALAVSALISSLLPAKAPPSAKQ